MSNAVIAGFVRTPFHFAKKGKLTGVRPDDLAAHAVKALIERSKVDPHAIEDVIMGCAYPEAEQGSNIARIVSLLVGLPHAAGGATINRFCGSSMTGIHYAVGQIAIGAGEVFVCAGVESMTRVPQGGFNPAPNPRFKRPDNPGEIQTEAYISMGRTAENVASRYKISRTEQEQFALESQQKASAAQSAGKLQAEVVAVSTPEGWVQADGCLRPQTSLAGLAALKPAFFETGTVTAGTSSPLTDGSAAVLVCSEEYAKRNGLKIYARIKAVAVAGCEPEFMGMGPVPATIKALARSGLKVSDIDVVEINEAFSSQAIASLRELGIDQKRVNLDGGALALGHPLGATGARITGKAAQLLCREGKRYALATQCIGGGQGVATILEAVS